MASFGSTPALIVAAGVGAAASVALEPAFEVPRQDAWSRNANRVLDPGLLARLVAQGGISLGSAQGEAARSGFDSDKLDALVWLTQTVPGTAELMFLWRYGIIDKATWREGMVKLGQRPDFIDAMAQTFTLPLDQGAIAVAIHRGIMDGAGLLLQEPPTTPGKVPIVPPSSIDPVAQAAALGISKEQLRILVGNTGLPLSLGEMLQLLNRGKVTEDDVKRSVAESNLRNEYMDVAVDLRRRLLTPHDYAELQLRGYQSKDERDAGAALSGMTAADTQLLYDMLGRSVNVHQVLIGERRGGKYTEGQSFAEQTAGIPPEYLSSLERGNLRPEFYQLAYANRESYPSYFVIRPLVQSGAITLERATELFLGMGWPEDVAKAAPAAFKGTAGTGSTDPHVGKAETQLWNATHSSYVKDRTDDATATANLGTIGVAADSIPKVLALWQAERELTRAGLSASQIKKAYTEATFTKDEATARLVELGWSAADAGVYLGE